MQSVLLPKLPNDISDAFSRLVANLNKFNGTFKENTQGLGRTLSKINEAYSIQADIVESIQKMDVAKMEYKKRSDMDGYWEERDVSTNKIIAITQLNNEYDREGHCYVFNNSGNVNTSIVGLCGIFLSSTHSPCCLP